MFNQLLRLAKHSIVYGLGAAATSIVSFFLLPMYTRFLSPADYGILAIFNATISVMYVISYLGLGASLLQFYVEADNEQEKKEILSTVFIFLTAINLIICIVPMVFAKEISQLVFHSNLYTTHFRVMFLTIFFDVGVYIALSIFRAKQKSVNYIAVSLVRLVMTTFLNVLLLGVLHQGVLGVLEATLISLIVLYAVLIASLIKDMKLQLSITKLKKMLLFGLPFVPADLADWLLSLADRYFLQFLSTSQQLGLYSLGYTFGSMIGTLITAPLALVWQPFLISIAKNKDAKQIYASTFTYFLLVGVFVFLGLSLLSQEVIHAMTTSPFYDAYKVVPLVALAFLLEGCYLVFEGGIYLVKKTQYIPLVMGMATVVNLALNYFLDRRFGMEGAAIALVISYATMPIAMFFISRKLYPVPYEFDRVFKIIIAAVPIYVGGIFIKNHSVLIDGLLRLAICLTYPILLYSIKFYKSEELVKVKIIYVNVLGLIREWRIKHL
jgi:O-antigen/teichoic acid export membrane protein